MEKKIGIIAGEGKFPLMVLREAKKEGYQVAVAGLKNIAFPELEKEADFFIWVGIGEVGKLVNFLNNNNVKKAIFAGRVKHFSIYENFFPDPEARLLLTYLEDKKPTSIFRIISEFLSSKGVELVDSTIFLSKLLPCEGILTRNKPSKNALEDIEFGWKIAKNIAGMDIGQTIVVKDKAVIAVEAMEGTDETLKRAMSIGGDGIVVIKVSRPQQDMRFDVPVVGLSTVRILSEVKNPVLCIEAYKTLFFDMEESIKFANERGMAIVARRDNE